MNDGSTPEESAEEPKSQVVYHTQVPMDMKTFRAFIPDILVPAGAEEGDAFKKLKLQEAVAMFLTQEVQPYIMVSEARVTQKNKGDGVEREGTLYTISLAVGIKPIIQTPSGEDMLGKPELKLITTGKN